mmetsp:Transcript_4448/g.20192  ORF Transcript_4448/g.20192 Transcript_4448/m.20192 type:complete len:308 (-) Transcript_4448:1009-1932(-)
MAWSRVSRRTPMVELASSSCLRRWSNSTDSAVGLGREFSLFEWTGAKGADSCGCGCGCGAGSIAGVSWCEGAGAAGGDRGPACVLIALSSCRIAAICDAISRMASAFAEPTTPPAETTSSSASSSPSIAAASTDPRAVPATMFAVNLTRSAAARSRRSRREASSIRFASAGALENVSASPSRAFASDSASVKPITFSCSSSCFDACCSFAAAASCLTAASSSSSDALVSSHSLKRVRALTLRSSICLARSSAAFLASTASATSASAAFRPDISRSSDCVRGKAAALAASSLCLASSASCLCLSAFAA